MKSTPRRRFAFVALPLIAATLMFLPLTRVRAAAPGTASDVAAPVAQQSFLRFVDNGRAGGKLETAVARYRNKDGVTVDLVAAVHIGEKSYYQGLDDSFAGYDAVLYELVKPKDVEAPRPGYKSENPIAQFQHLLKDQLNLDFQLDDIDYTRENFVHADMTKEEFEKLQGERGESMESLLLQQILHALTAPPPTPEQQEKQSQDTDQMIHEIIGALTRPDAERQMKLILAKQFGEIEKNSADFGLGNTVILTERNKHAVQVLKDTLKAGGKKKLAIFYGAAHMPGISESLKEMGFEPVSTEWKTAWDLTIRADQPSAAEKLLNFIFQSLDDAGN